MSYLQAQIAQLIQQSKQQEHEEPYYEVLQKITLSGVEYFDLGYKVSDFEIGDTIRFEGIVKGTDAGTIPSSGSQLMFSLGNDGGQWLGKAQNGTKYAFGSSNTSTINFNVEVLANVTIALSGSSSRPTFTISGSVTSDTETSNITQRSATPTYYNFPLLFGAGTKSTGEKSYGGDYTIKCGKIYVNGIMTKDFIPVLDSQMRPCLYDRISKTFTYAKKISDGTDATSTLTFKRWNKFDVDYISSSGSQEIATGLSGFTRFTGTAECTSLSSKSQVLFGDSSGGGHFFASRISTTQKWGTTTSSTAGYTSVDTLSKVDFDVSFASGKTFGSVNNESFTYSIAGTFSDFSIFVNATGNSYPFYGNLYELKAYQGDNLDELVRDLKPSVRTYNDGTNVVTKAFMYDEVYNKAYDNAGTGSFNAYIQSNREVYSLAMHNTMDIDGFYLAEDGTKTVSSDGTSCYTEAIQVKEGDIIEWTVTAEAVTANKRIHGYTTDADITTGQKGSWVSMLAKIVFSTTSDTTQTVTFTVPSGVNYIRMSHANVRESKDSIVRIRTYEVGKAIKFPQNNGFTLDAPNSSNFILDLLTRATTTSSYYILDTRQQTGSSSDDEFGIGGSSSGATVNWKCEAESNLIKTNGTNWTRNSNYTYSQLLVGYKDGNTFKRTAVFYDFNNQKISDIEIATASRDIANNTKPLTVLHTTSSNWLQNGAEIYYFKYLQDGNDVWYDCIPVRNATVTSSLMLFNKVNNTSLPNTGSGTPTFVALD